MSERDHSCQPGVIDFIQTEQVKPFMGRRVGLGLQEVFMLAQKRTNLDPDNTHTFTLSTCATYTPF